MWHPNNGFLFGANGSNISSCFSFSVFWVATAKSVKYCRINGNWSSLFHPVWWSEFSLLLFLSFDTRFGTEHKFSLLTKHNSFLPNLVNRLKTLIFYSSMFYFLRHLLVVYFLFYITVLAVAVHLPYYLLPLDLDFSSFILAHCPKNGQCSFRCLW